MASSGRRFAPVDDHSVNFVKNSNDNDNDYDYDNKITI